MDGALPHTELEYSYQKMKWAGAGKRLARNRKLTAQRKNQLLTQREINKEKNLRTSPEMERFKEMQRGPVKI